MQKIILAAAVLLCISAAAQAPAQGGISFEHGSFSEALARAKKENKLVMLDAYASWCGPCKWMAKNIFPQKEVGDFYNSRFISVKIDMEKGEGVELSRKYEVNAYPTFFYIDPSGKMVHRVCGGMEAADFIQAGKDALDPEKQVAALQKKFAAGGDAAAALSYFDAAEKGCMDAEADAKKYIDGLKPETYLQKENYALIDKFISDYTHQSILYILDNYDKFTAAIGEKEIAAKILSVYRNTIIIACRRKDEAMLNEIRGAYRQQKKAPSAWLDAYSNMLWAGVTMDTVAYFRATIEFTDKFMQDDAQELNSAAWDFYEKTGTAAYLQKAEAWAKRSVELMPGYANNDTYAAVLYKLGKYREAKAAAEQSIRLGKEEGADVKSTQELLRKIEEKTGR